MEKRKKSDVAFFFRKLQKKLLNQCCTVGQTKELIKGVATELNITVSEISSENLHEGRLFLFILEPQLESPQKCVLLTSFCFVCFPVEAFVTASVCYIQEQNKFIQIGRAIPENTSYTIKEITSSRNFL